MNYRNLIVSVGTIVEMPTVRETTNGKKVTTVNIVVSKNYLDKQTGEIVERPTYLKIEWWNPNKIIEHLKKGTLVQIASEINNHKQDVNGTNVHGYKLILQNIDILKFTKKQD